MHWLIHQYWMSYFHRMTFKVVVPGNEPVYTRVTPLCTFTQKKYFRNLIKSTQNQIVFTLFRLIWNQTDVATVWIQIKSNNLISV